MRSIRGIPMLLALTMLAPGCLSLGTDADNTSKATPAKLFERTLRAVPKGKRVYWFGPSAEGFALRRVSPDAGVDDGVSIHYADSPEFDGGIDIITYMTGHRTGGMNDPAAGRRVVARLVTRTGQLVVFTTNRVRDAVPSARLLRRLRGDVVALTDAEIRALPDNWIQIPH
jgi:hypothetical protein